MRLRILRSGSGGNAILVDAGDARLLIDAGLPADVIVRELAALPILPQDLTAVLLTHEHDDHAKGALTLSRMAGCPVLANQGTIASAGEALDGPQIERFVTGTPFRLGSLMIDPFALPHDAAEPVGFAISQNGSRLVIATDLGSSSDEVVERACDADMLIIESNYDLRLLSVSPYPWFLKNRILSTTGHLSNDAAAETIRTAAAGRLRTAVLVHLSDINNLTPLARDTVQWTLEREAITHVAVHAVRPNGTSNTYELQ